MKRAIIVRGQSGSGKTTIIHWIYRWLKLHYKPVITNFWPSSVNPWLIKDFGCNMQIGHLRITICSTGDEEHEVVRFLNNCLSSNTNIIIGACRGKGGTNRAVIRILDPHGRSKPVVTNFIQTHHHHSVRAFNKRCVSELRAQLIGLY